ncbi:MAG: wax ester/triacylglycerol synthase domain-containing protein [Mycobacterium sp.]|uniref:wax ester/triacylglycerol synthase domain-containing protein n=1 Tax=Mycobacterium sp. TaxID=1785 RepID=UPI003F9DBB4E
MVAAAQAREQVAPLWRRHPHRAHWPRSGTGNGATTPRSTWATTCRFSHCPRRLAWRELWDLVSRLDGGLLDRSRPLWQLHLIEGLADGRYAVYIKTHLAGRAIRCSVSDTPSARAIHPGPQGTNSATRGHAGDR